MIRYSLACDAGHRFDSWFGDSAAFDDLAGRGLVSCPNCSSTNVAKSIMAPAVISNSAVPARLPPSVPVAALGAENVSLLDQRQKELRNLVKGFRDKVLAATQDVGPQFPEQVRRMHDGEIPHQDIRGQATVEEARALLDDGIGILPVPVLPDEFN